LRALELTATDVAPFLGWVPAGAREPALSGGG